MAFLVVVGLCVYSQVLRIKISFRGVLLMLLIVSLLKFYG